MEDTISEKTLERLCIYRRILNDLNAKGVSEIFSHELAEMAKGRAAQVRRDLMDAECNGTDKRGYSVVGLLDNLDHFLDNPDGEPVILIGVGNLGRALLSHFAIFKNKMKIIAAFDNDSRTTNRVVHNCHCYSMDKMANMISSLGIKVGIIAVPGSAAQEVVSKVIGYGLTGIINFAPVSLHVPPKVYVDNIDFTRSLEKVSYYSRKMN